MRSGTKYLRNAEDDKTRNTAEDIARMVFAFAAEAKTFTEGIDESDEVKLLRLRTRKNEIVIVPGKSLHGFTLGIMLTRTDRYEISTRCHT